MHLRPFDRQYQCSSVDDNGPWPRKGENYFKGDDNDWPTNACINFAPDAWFGYAEGFRKGADYLVDRVEATFADQDLLVYPIVFGYRHAVELRLKSIVRAARSLAGEPGDAPTHHRLDSLWSTARPLLERAFPMETTDDLDAASEAIAQLHDADPGSTGFRYPTDWDAVARTPWTTHQPSSPPRPNGWLVRVPRRRRDGC
jgi:hypothetical protein